MACRQITRRTTSNMSFAKRTGPLLFTLFFSFFLLGSSFIDRITKTRKMGGLSLIVWVILSVLVNTYGERISLFIIAWSAEQSTNTQLVAGRMNTNSTQVHNTCKIYSSQRGERKKPARLPRPATHVPIVSGIVIANWGQNDIATDYIV